MRPNGPDARFVPVLVTLCMVLFALAACGGGQAEVGGAGTTTQVSSTSLAALDFRDPAHGWAVGGMGRQAVLSRTTDGSSWQTLPLPIAGRPTDVEFVDKLHGWVAVDSSAEGGGAEVTILRTSDGGRRWRLSRIPGVDPYEGAFSFTGPREGWFVGAARDLRVPVVLRTGDGGATWQKVRLTNQLVTLTSVGFQEPPLQGWISGYDNQHVGTPSVAFTTSDGGETWKPLEGDAAPHSGLFRLDDGHLWSLGEEGDRPQMLRLRLESGRWEPIGSPGDLPTLFAFGSADVGWGVRFETGEEGVVVGWRLLRTEDGGRTWTDSGVDIPAQPTDIACPSADTAVVATDAGSVVSVTR